MKHVLVIAFLLVATVQAEQMAHISITHHEGEPSLIEIQLEPNIGSREVFFSLRKGERGHRGTIELWRRLQANAPGLYRLEYRFPEGGLWRFYVHYGTGLSGFDARLTIEITPIAGQVDYFSMPFRYYPDAAEELPAYVQPMGYTGLAALVGVLLFAVARVLRRLREKLQEAVKRSSGLSRQN